MGNLLGANFPYGCQQLIAVTFSWFWEENAGSCFEHRNANITLKPEGRTVSIVTINSPTLTFTLT